MHPHIDYDTLLFCQLGPLGGVGLGQHRVWIGSDRIWIACGMGFAHRAVVGCDAGASATHAPHAALRTRDRQRAGKCGRARAHSKRGHDCRLWEPSVPSSCRTTSTCTRGSYSRARSPAISRTASTTPYGTPGSSLQALPPAGCAPIALPHRGSWSRRSRRKPPPWGAVPALPRLS